jgi:hypothetical protein
MNSIFKHENFLLTVVVLLCLSVPVGCATLVYFGSKEAKQECDKKGGVVMVVGNGGRSVCLKAGVVL